MIPSKQSSSKRCSVIICINDDDADLINDSEEKEKTQLQSVIPIFAEFNLQINGRKKKHMVLKRDQKKNEIWRSTKKFSSLMGDEDMLCRKQLSITTLYNLNNIWIRKNRVREYVQIKLYKTIVKPVLM